MSPKQLEMLELLRQLADASNEMLKQVQILDTMLAEQYQV